MTTVQALYDFHAEPGSTELTISTGDILTVVRDNVGDGWMEGTNQAGQTGLFPAAYVEEIAVAPPKEPPPPCPVYSEVPETGEWGNINEWQNNAQSQDNEDWDDDWDEDDDVQSTNNQYYNTNSNMVTTLNHNPRAGEPAVVGKKSFNRFSNFVKSGGENYIIGALKLMNPIQESDFVHIIEIGSTVGWHPIEVPYSCVIASPKRATKLRGLKSYITYQITPTFNNIQVSRRYKQFDWLHERLQEKFSAIPIPPLPDKQISGRYEEQFIEHRMTQLQAFVNCVCRHPVLSRCAVWMHFITCTDERKWKKGKREAERDELVGAKFFMAIKGPEKQLQTFLVEKEMEECSKFIMSMDQAVKNLSTNVMEQSKRMQNSYNKDIQKIGQAFTQLAAAFDLETTPGNPRGNLTNAIRTTGDIYNELGRLMEEQPKLDWEPLGDVLHIYKGIITSFPDILGLSKNAQQKRKELEKTLPTSEMAAVTHRTDKVSYAVTAEINHFHQERANDFKMAMRGFLAEQINYYQNIVDRLKVAMNAYDH